MKYGEIPKPNSLDSMGNVELKNSSQLEAVDVVGKLEKELKVKLLFISSGSTINKSVACCEELGRSEDVINIKHCNILFQGSALLEAAKLVIKSIEDGAVDASFKFKEKRDFYCGEDFLGSVIGHDIPYAIYGVKDHPYAQIEALFRKIREEFEWDAPPDKILEMCRYITNELEKLILERDVLLEYFRILDSFNVSREEMVKYNIRNRILEKVPWKINNLINNPAGENIETQLEKDIIKIFKTRGSLTSLPIADFLELMKSLDALLDEYLNLDDENRVKKDTMINYKLNQLLYRKDIEELIKG